MPRLTVSWASTASPGPRSTATPWSEPTLRQKLQLVDPPTLPRPANSTEYSTLCENSTLVVTFQFVSNVFRSVVVLMIDGWDVNSRSCALCATSTVCTCGQL